MAAIAGRKADIYIVAGTGSGTAFTSEACGALSGALTTRQHYRITDTTKRFWNPAATLTVETSPDGIAWSTAAPGTYQVGYAGGLIVFNTSQASGTQVRASGEYLSVSQLGEAYQWTLDAALDVADQTTFGSTWKSFKTTQRGATGSFRRYFVDSYFLTNAANPLLLVLYSDYSASVRYEALAKLTQNSIEAMTSGLVGESLSFTVDGPVNAANA